MTRRKPSGDVVYFIQNTVTGNVKIGKASNAGERLRNLQTGNDCHLVLLGTIRGSFKEEGELHDEFADLRISHRRSTTEWFRPGASLVSYLVQRRMYPLHVGALAPHRVLGSIALRVFQGMRR